MNTEEKHEGGHWAKLLKIGDFTIATIRDPTDGTKNRHNVLVSVIDNNGISVRAMDVNNIELEFIIPYNDLRRVACVTAIFDGQDGSCGYQTGHEYKLIIAHAKGENIRVQNYDGGGHVEYESMIAFLSNWLNVA